MNCKVVTRMMPVDMIIFDDGTEAKYGAVYSDICDMRDSDRTDFYRNNAYDNAVYQFIVQNEKFNDTVGKGYTSTRDTELIGISWKNNREFVDTLLNELRSMRERKEQE